MRVVRAFFPLGSDLHECVDKRMHCSPSLQLLGTLIWLLQLVLILRWWSFDWVVLFLLGWNPALAIANTDSTCQGQHWELQFPQVTWGRGEEKNPKDSCWIQLGRWADDTSCRISWEFQIPAMRKTNLTSDIFLWILAVFHLCGISGQAQVHTDITILIKPGLICIFQFS